MSVLRMPCGLSGESQSCAAPADAAATCGGGCDCDCTNKQTDAWVAWCHPLARVVCHVGLLVSCPFYERFEASQTPQRPAGYPVLFQRSTDNIVLHNIPGKACLCTHGVLSAECAHCGSATMNLPCWSYGPNFCPGRSPGASGLAVACQNLPGASMAVGSF